MNSTLKTLFLWMAIFVVVILLWNTFQHSKANHQELNFTQFMEAVEKGKVAEGIPRTYRFHCSGFRQGTGLHREGGCHA